MAQIKEADILEITKNADIVDIIKDYLEVTKKGRNYVAICPFHDDHTPSLVISRERGIFNCFTCRTGGNAISFVMKYENVSYPEAIKIVAQKIGYDLKIDNSYNNYDSKYKSDYEIMEFAKKYYLNNIFTEEGKKAREYLYKRGIDDEIIKEFSIGYALKNSNNLYQLLSKKGKSIEKLDSLGLINKVDLNVYDTFNNRILIPISDLNGHIVGFTGRIFNGEENTSKYINTRETEIFKKSNILFNYYNAKKYVREEKSIIVVEGNMDAIKCSAKGIKNVVALQGTALSLKQIDALKKLKAPVILMLDNDSAGLNATVKNGDLLIENGVDTFVVRLSDTKDPDEYIEKNGVESLKDNIKHAIKYIDFKLEYLKKNKNLDSLEDIISYVKEVIFTIKDQDDLTKSIIISKISKDYQIDAEVIKNSLGGIKKVEKKKEIPRNTKVSKYDIAARKIIYYMMSDSKYITIYQNRLGYFKNKIERVVASEIVYYYNLYKEINVRDFTTYIMHDNDSYNFVSSVIGENSDCEVNTQEFDACISVILGILKKDEIENLKVQIKQEMDINKKCELISKLTELKKKV